MHEDQSSSPYPALSIEAEFPDGPQAVLMTSVLPAQAGVLLIEDAQGAALVLATTANLRRFASAKFDTGDEAAVRSRRVDLRSTARRVRAVCVGSAFEADWAWLQLARRHLPQTYRSLLDRWQAWFVECDASAEFPQFIKTARPAHAPSTYGGFVYLGPFPDKHSAWRYIEMLQDAFDLCRYHHILIQAPRATACAYKEMGRCPAPCDGTISMASYREQVVSAITFAAAPIERWRANQEQQMKRFSEALDFESAQRCRVRLERTEAATKSEFARVDRLERFRFVALMASERRGWARIFLVLGGSIVPNIDVPVTADREALRACVIGVIDNAARHTADFGASGIENIGMICRHMFHPRKGKSPAEFFKIGEDRVVDRIVNAIMRIHRSAMTDDAGADVAEQSLEC